MTNTKGLMIELIGRTAMVVQTTNVVGYLCINREAKYIPLDGSQHKILEEETTIK